MDSERSDSSKPATPLSFAEQAPSLDIDLEEAYVESPDKPETKPIREARELALLPEDIGFDSESSRPSPIIPPVEQRRASRLTPPRGFLSEVGSETGGVPVPLSGQPQPEPAKRLTSLLAPQARPIPKAAKQSFPTSFEQSPIRSPNTTAREWTRTVQPYSASPSNLINLSESPQTVPSSYEEKSLFAGYQPSTGDKRANRAETQYSQSTSPPIHTPLPPSLLNNNNFNRRPLSGQSQFREGERRSMFEDDRIARPQQPSNNNYPRRNSGYSQFTDRLRTSPLHAFSPPIHFPPTHGPPPMSQYYGACFAPDLNLGGGRRTNGLKPGERGYYVGFDTMNVVRGGRAENKSVVITGYEGGLDVRHVSKRGSTQIARLGGLRGGVCNAKILPWTIDAGPNVTRGSTLVAVVVHGPVLEDQSEAVNFGEEAGDGFDKRRSGASATGTEQRRKSMVTHYQTSVEVYDLRSQNYIATLLTVPKVELQTQFMGPRFSPPPPSGALSIDADAGNIVITSGQTGEVWIFQQAEIKRDEPLSFRALGKVWTTVQQPSNTESTDYSQRIGSERGGNNNEPIKKPRTKTGLISLRGRWLVYCPSPNIHAISLRALISTSAPKSALASINSYAPPQLPSANCVVDTPPGGSLTSRLGRQAAQGAIVGATYLAGQGTRLFNNYWKPPTPTAQGWTPGPGEPSGQMFPPTHGSNSGKEITASEAVTVSIIDLHKLANLGQGKKISAATMATFKLPDGCSFLSLSPSGLQLFTANGRGDMHYIWDLMKMQYPKPSTLTLPRQGYPTQPHIRQIFRFERLTVSRIVDVVWALPRGRTIAMVTERNTVHFFDIPGQVFVWPPPRRICPVNGTGNDALSTARAVSAAPAVAAKLAVGAFSTVKGFTGWGRRASQTQATLTPSASGLSTMGSANGNAPATNKSGALASTLAGYAGAGSKMLASGVSKSLNSTMQTVQTLRRSNDNKLHLPDSAFIVQPGCMSWLGERRGGKQNFAVVLDGIVKVHEVMYVKGKAGGKGRKREPPRVVVMSHVKDIGLPSISDTMVSPMVMRALEIDGEDLGINSPSVKAEDDNNSRTAVLLVQPLTLRRRPAAGGGANPITMAEINTSTPYSPFVYDHRVTLYTYSADDYDDDNWNFGGNIEGQRLDTGYDEDDGEREIEGYALERTVSRDGEVPIISTTRRRHMRGGEMGGVAEEGFFDEDVEWVASD